MNKKKGFLIAMAIVMICAAVFWWDYDSKQQKRKAAMPLAIWESSLKENTKDYFVLGKLQEKDVVYLKTKGFIEENYLAYASCPQLSSEVCVRYVNEGILNEKNATKIMELSKDPYFLEKNLELYLKYPQKTIRQTVEFVNVGRYATFFKDKKKVDLQKNYLLNVNKYFHFEADYVPEDLENIDSRYGFPGKLRKEAYKAYIEMDKEARKAGLNLEIISAFRTYQRQQELFNFYTEISGEKAAETYSARLGFSEHRSGLSLDSLSPGYDFDTFESSKEAKWLAENAHLYGFILRYPKEKENVTGYIYEPWHFRYIGKKAATHMKTTGLCYDEYYSVYVESD